MKGLMCGTSAARKARRPQVSYALEVLGIGVKVAAGSSGV